MAKDINNPENVSLLIQQLEPELAKLIEAIRQLILNTDERIGEQIKWNSPSFFYLGEMRVYDAKTYQRDLIIIHVRKGFPLLIFPNGANINDTTGILEGNYTDGRRMLTLKSIAELNAKAEGLQKVIKQWLHLVEIN
ncbi:hypothetical protein D9M68_580730 [compost metagenome]